MLLQSDQTILFQGDSITDVGRNREDPYSMGNGYANMTAAWLGAKYPYANLSFINRGISGDRVPDLQKRWQKDCIELKPDWVSIMIGVNDCRRRYDSNNPTSTETYEYNYRELIKTTKAGLPNVKLILIEPFVLPFPEDRNQWREDLDPKIDGVRRLAREFEAVLVPLDGIFASAACKRPPAFWAHDGVHPSPEGHALIAQSWLNAMDA